MPTPQNPSSPQGGESAPAKRPRLRPTDVELGILRVLWDRGPSTVKDVHAVLSGNRNLAYTGVLRMMQIMHEKGLLERDERARSHVYRPAHSRDYLQKGIVEDVVQKVFGGSARDLVAAALRSGTVDDAERAEIRKLLREAEGREKETR